MGKKVFSTKKKNLFIPNTELGQMAKSLIGAPILAPTPKLDNINEYYERQFKKLNNYFCNKPYYDFSTADKLLRKYNNSQSPFIFLLIDMVESTKRSIILALSNILWVVVLDCDFFVQDIAFVPSYSHVS